jgi:predicted small lipoprotein YifL
MRRLPSPASLREAPSPALRERGDRARRARPGLDPGARWVRAAACLLLVSLTIAGCGKKNPPQPPPGVPNTYPRAYPSV